MRYVWYGLNDTTPLFDTSKEKQDKKKGETGKLEIYIHHAICHGQIEKPLMFQKKYFTSNKFLNFKNQNLRCFGQSR